MIYHPGKCGGSTIENLFLRPLCDTDLDGLFGKPCIGALTHGELPAEWMESRLGLMLGFLPSANSVNGIGDIFLQHADIYASRNLLGADTVARMFKIAFVRNPFPRLLSAFFYNGCHRKWTFRDFVLSQLEQELLRNRPYTVGHFGEMHRYTHFEGMQFVDFVGRLEHIETDIGELSNTVGIPLDLVGIRQSAKTIASKVYGHYSEAYDDAMVERIHDLYRKDFDCFGYHFERALPFHPRDEMPVQPASAHSA